ncbi:hypothetical protein CcaverHIS002_0305330 [Cutaneotrichosporon cavernicola]|uniref:Golgi apparatus membrane protein TVP38 n=1 Tax=Cutaneotrichosporon cavernicola TaxID=279322 RepID=A0AA48I9S5_9TREE|nr:uncharacterized protein CcaverHIS019_0305300 [Cutaneotrichosporon cavernicola]BEI82665.1 hypothetical protein CcaverHIS002_0305330 [Cutaneotrichosporon cavernicola]BEI90460.1 hypothetical protein CcaverHIS019_0305300 [Cutaneotrichosporon cavernicola]BEI98234.1 hypothetical protein CcaverHIS631_0305330 [Cutaneotrichosporon cavernicola]BEJ06010.1 hypothetical protein CcaverHIS641_0305320 [Cutaneotrichosporon cavernicola]
MPQRSSTAPQPRRLRARTATVSFGQMSRDIAGGVMVETPSEFGIIGPIASSPVSLGGSNSLGVRIGRRTSKSVSGGRPPLSTSASSHRTLGYSNPYAPEAGLSTGGPSGGSPNLGPTRVRNGLKRRISTPNLFKGRSLVPDDDGGAEPDRTTTPIPSGLQASSKGNNVVETRARSTSTSIVVPQTLVPQVESSTTFAEEPTIVTLPSLSSTALPTPPWSGMYVTPPSPPSTAGPRQYQQDYEPHRPEQDNTDLLSSAYDMGETVFSRVISWVRPKRQRRSRRPSYGSDNDSEKGLNGSEDEEFDEKDGGDTRTRSGPEWNVIPGSRLPDSPSYFALPPTPPDDCPYDQMGYPSLPTPAISSQSLSHGGPTKRQRRASRAAALKQAQADGWWVKVYRTVSVSGSGKTAEVLRELGWTVGLLALLFVVSFSLVVYAVMSMPITHLKSMPKSTTDLQLLSADIRAYMKSSNSGWWHTVGVLTYVGCWKHAWSVPGAVVLNILVGSLFDTVPALGLLTLITASGSLGAYMLSRPLAPLIGVLFPKPLALVRAALAPDSVPHPSNVTSVRGETITPVRVSDDPREPPLGSAEDRPNVWSRLFLMRAMGFVPWSGMNVACGVVGVDWRIFWLTTAGGSASWSYVTASVGNILGSLALPTQGEDGVDVQSESLTSLLRDPWLIFKLVALTVLTVLPVLLKRRIGRSPVDDTDSDDDSLSDLPERTLLQPHSMLGLDTGPPSLSIHTANLDSGEEYPSEPASPLAMSLASFTPTPHMFDLLSFGRTAMRQGVRFVVGGARTAVTRAQRVLGDQ